MGWRTRLDTDWGVEMALTFTSWTNYTDEDGAKTLDWSSADAIRGYPLRPHAEAVRQAIAERYLATGTSVPAALSVAVPLMGPAFAAWAAAVQAAITDRMAAFVNHLDSSGDWSGQDTVPLWNEAAILANLGISRLDPGGFPSADWIFQQRQVLNLLVWNKISGTNQFLWQPYSAGQKFGSGVSWDDASAAFSSASWTLPVVLPYGASHWVQNLGGGRYQFVRARSMPRVALFSDPFSVLVDFYPIFDAIGEYENNDYPGSVPGKLFRAVSDSSAPKGATKYLEIGNFPDANLITHPIDDLGKAGWKWASPGDSGYLTFTQVSKFNTPGGFIFQ